MSSGTRSAGRALVQHPTDELRERHLDLLARRELEHRRGRLHALGDHVHLRDDLVEGAALPELDADVAVAALRAAARRDEIAHAREPGEGQRLAAERDAEPRELREAAGDERGLRVVAVVETVGHAGTDRQHVLERARDLAPDDVGVRVHAKRRRHEQLLQLAATASSRTATTVAVGWPAATSRARFGPLSTPMLPGSWPSSTSATTSVMRRLVPCSTPFERLITAASRRR